jgi:hypothetical protein
MQKHKQLAKGHDDLRQDAVMQQFFALVNTLLSSDAKSAARQLRMAVYRVVVFTSASGARYSCVLQLLICYVCKSCIECTRWCSWRRSFRVYAASEFYRGSRVLCVCRATHSCLAWMQLTFNFVSI